MTGKDILLELGALDPELILMNAPEDKELNARRRPNTKIIARIGAIAAAIVFAVFTFALVNNMLKSEDFVADNYAEVMDKCDTAVFAEYQSKTEHLTYTEYVFKVTEVLCGEVSSTNLTVNSEKNTPFASDDMEKYATEVSSEFKEGEEYFLTLNENTKGEISFFVEQIIPTEALSYAVSSSGDFVKFLNQNGLNVAISRDDLREFLKYIFGTPPTEAVCMHTYGEWEIVSFPSDSFPGIRKKVCTLCGYELTEEFIATDGLEFEFHVSAKTATLVSAKECILTDIIIPEYVNGCRVTEIGALAFENSNVKTVQLPDSVTRIGMGAFKNCRSLESVELSKSLNAIEKQAFFKCENLPRITLPETLVAIGDEAFYSCGNLSGVIIPDSVISIGKYVFTRCIRLVYASLPKGLETIPEGTFLECWLLEEAVIPETVTVVEENAFSQCYTISDVSFLKNVTYIGGYAFSNCSFIELATFSNKLKYIGEFAFYECEKLDKVHIPGTVKTISDEAFKRCAALNELTIHNGVTTIGKYAFSECERLNYVTLPVSVERIEEGAFKACHNLLQIAIRDGVNYIGSYAFAECYVLGSVNLPEGIENIPIGTFAYCRNFKSITIPSTVTEIGEEAFLACVSLKTITIRGILTSIGADAFSADDALEQINYPGTKAQWQAIKRAPNKYLSWVTPCSVSCTDGIIPPTKLE